MWMLWISWISIISRTASALQRAQENNVIANINGVATDLENLEKSGNSKVVREKSGKMEKVRETEICLLDFERAEELKLQLLASCGPGLWICSCLTLL